MPRLWLTYAWRDNEDADVDFVVHRLTEVGIDVKLDRTQLLAGGRLWEQIDAGIRNPDLDGWAIFATRVSLESQPCREELGYALQRTLEIRGGTFPLIGIFPARLAPEIVPFGLQSRLYVVLEDPRWATSVLDGLVGRSTGTIPAVERVVCKVHRTSPGFTVELRPRDTAWTPVEVGILSSEADALQLAIWLGPPNSPQSGPYGGMFSFRYAMDDKGRRWQYMQMAGSANFSTSLYASFAYEPSEFKFGSPVETWEKPPG